MDRDADLAAIGRALRFLVRTGIVDYNGHASQRTADGFVLNSADSNRARVTAADLSYLRLDGTLQAGPRPPNEAPLHAAIYSARPEVNGVVHGHPDFLTLLSSARHPLAPVIPQGALVWDMPVYPFAHSISTTERGRAVALHLGQGRGAILQGHGIVTVGADLTEACALALYAEQTALRQVQAAPLGGAAPLTPDEVAEYRITLDSKALFAKCEAFHLTPERD